MEHKSEMTFCGHITVTLFCFNSMIAMPISQKQKIKENKHTQICAMYMSLFKYVEIRTYRPLIQKELPKQVTCGTKSE